MLNNCLLALLTTITSATPIDSASVSSTGNSAFDSYQTLTSGNTPEAIAVGVLSIIFGLFLAFAGYRLFKAALFVAGFIGFADLTYWLLIRFEPSTGYGSNTGLVLLLVPIAVGILGGFLSLYIWRVGLSLIGFLGGAALGVLILSFQTGGVINSDAGRIIFVIALGIVCGILIHFIERPAIMLATSLLGSFTLFLGIDSFAHTGFAQVVQNFLFGGLQASAVQYVASGGALGFIIATFVLTLIATGAQWHFNKGRQHRKQ